MFDSFPAGKSFSWFLRSVGVLDMGVAVSMTMYASSTFSSMKAARAS